jgi:predicted RNA-binding Zn-ribbon protein involved in translation (DUF1610 family)
MSDAGDDGGGEGYGDWADGPDKANDYDYGDSGGGKRRRRGRHLYRVTCRDCDHEWTSNNGKVYRKCPQCGDSETTKAVRENEPDEPKRAPKPKRTPEPRSQRKPDHPVATPEPSTAGDVVTNLGCLALVAMAVAFGGCLWSLLPKG